MAFYPETGPWSQEDFTDPNGIILSEYQTVTGGFFALKPNVSGSSNFISRWSNISSWSFTNNLNTTQIISGSFLRLSGAAITGQAVPREKLGYQALITGAGAYEINTPFPQYVYALEYTGYSGQTRQCFMLGQDSPDKSWYNSFIAGNTETTIEFDVSSLRDIYSGNATIGFTTGQQLLTTLPPIRTPYIGHGLYIDNGQYWDYFEINPFGIRSINHPEFGIPADFTSPKRVRIGLNGQNIILTTENGRGAFGRALLDTPVLTGSDPKIVFGAMPISGVRNRFPLNAYGISGVVGNTLWDNVRILYGASQLTTNTGLSFYYTLSAQTGYTEIYDPGIPVTNWNNAVIGFIPTTSTSTTTVVLQYSGNTGWTDGPSTVITNQASPVSLNLSNVPVFYNSRTTSTHGRVENPTRFKLIHQSNGRTPPPVLDYISISAATEKSILEVTPNWKSVAIPITATMSVNSPAFDSIIAEPSTFSTFVLNSPTATGRIKDSFLTNEDTLRTGNVFIGGFGDIINAGNNSTAVRTFQTTGVTAVPNSEAARLLGGSQVDNCFYNSSLDNTFYGITGYPSYVNRRSFGELADGFNLVPSYTGRSVIRFSKKEVYRTIEEANRVRTNSSLGLNDEKVISAVQAVYVPSQIGLNPEGSVLNHDYSCGFEVTIPSGICSGRFIFSADVQIEKGNQLCIYASGLNVSGNPRWVLDGPDYRVFRKVSFPVTSQNNSGQIYVGLVVNSGTPGKQEFAYNVDNVTFTPYIPGWVYSTGIPTFFHQSGLLRDSYAGISTVPLFDLPHV